MNQNFPKQFLWGASTSSHQIEGGNVNNWSEWGKKTAEKRAKNIPNWYEFPKELLEIAKDPKSRISGKACNSFELWREDIKLLKELGLNSYRFSIEWSRIFPEKGVVSKKGLKYYKDLINGLKANNIEPVLTCWHWTLPLWIEKEGGLMAKDIEKYFKEYFDILAENFGEDIKYWVSINEPSVITSQSYLVGVWPPQKKSPFIWFYLYYFRMVKIHKIGYESIKRVNKEALIGVAKHNTVMESYNNMPWNILITKLGDFFWNHWYLKKIHKYLDFIGLNFYFHQKIGIRGIKNDNDRLSDMGWWLRPDSLYRALMDLKRYNLPIIITENGVADFKDQYREWWLDESFNAMNKALEDGINLIGYLHWSLLDNFEWAEGFWPKFGLVKVDLKTFERKIKKSGYYYKDLIEKNWIK